jgi:acyl-CoA synthetase (AMP-forming)/AMP-acid ligase II
MAQGQWTDRRFDAESDRVAQALRQRGIREREIVSLMRPNGLEFLVS